SLCNEPPPDACAGLIDEVIVTADDIETLPTYFDHDGFRRECAILCSKWIDDHHTPAGNQHAQNFFQYDRRIREFVIGIRDKDTVCDFGGNVWVVRLSQDRFYVVSLAHGTHP